jgi:hypothetical protein
VIRQICLSCYKTVELPDDAAGKDTPCPNCGKTISVPAKYMPGVAEGGGVAAASPPVPATPTPGAPPMSSDPSVPPGLKAESPPAAPVPPPPEAAGLDRGFGFSLNPLWLDWVPAACILLAFLLSFFPWVSMTLGGYSVMSQTGWDSFFGGNGYNYPPQLSGDGEKVKRWNAQWDELDDKLAGRTEDPTVKVKTDWLIVFYLLLMILTVALFVSERLVKDPNPVLLPAPLKFVSVVWPWRLLLLGGLAVLAFLMVWFQSMGGFGLQKSLDTLAKAEFKERLNDPNPKENQTRSTYIAIGQEANRYPAHQTFWLKLLLVVHAVAVVGMSARFWLAQRGPAKPLPRADVRW